MIYLIPLACLVLATTFLCVIGEVRQIYFKFTFQIYKTIWKPEFKYYENYDHTPGFYATWLYFIVNCGWLKG